MLFSKVQAIHSALLVSLVSCGTAGPFKGSEFEAARQTEVYPYSVRVTVKQTDTNVARGVMNPRLVSEEMKATIEQQVVESLRQYRVFAWPYPSQESRQADLELVVNISAPPGKELGKVTTNGYVWPNLFLWLLAGFPAWLLEDTEVDTGIQVAYELTQASMPDSGVVQNGVVSLTAEERLSFWDRAGLWQYVQQLIVPPFLVGSNKDIADASLYEKFVARMQGDIGARLKQDLWTKLLSHPQGPLPLLIAFPTGEGDLATVVLLSGTPLEQSEILESGPDDKPQTRQPVWTALFQKDEVVDLLRRLNAPTQVLALTDQFGTETQAYDYCYVSSDLTQQSLSWTDVNASKAPRIQAKFQGNTISMRSWTPRLTLPVDLKKA